MNAKRIQDFVGVNTDNARRKAGDQTPRAFARKGAEVEIMPNNVLLLPRVGDLVDKHQFWQYKGQNYIARLLENNPKYGFKRNFLQLAKGPSGKHYFSIIDFEKKAFYEVRSRGIDGAFIVNALYECVDITDSGVKLAEVARSHVVRELTFSPVEEKSRNRLRLLNQTLQRYLQPRLLELQKHLQLRRRCQRHRLPISTTSYRQF